VCHRVKEASSGISLALNVAPRTLSLLPTDSQRPRDIGKGKPRLHAEDFVWMSGKKKGGKEEKKAENKQSGGTLP